MIKLIEILNEIKETFENFAITRGKGAAKIASNAGIASKPVLQVTNWSSNIACKISQSTYDEVK